MLWFDNEVHVQWFVSASYQIVAKELIEEWLS